MDENLLEMANRYVDMMYLGSPHFTDLVDEREMVGTRYIAQRITPHTNVRSVNDGEKGKVADAYIGGICACQVRDMEFFDPKLLESGHVFYNVRLNGCGNNSDFTTGLESHILDEEENVSKFNTKNKDEIIADWFRRPMEDKVRDFTDYIINKTQRPENAWRMHMIPTILRYRQGNETTPVYSLGEIVKTGQERYQI